MKNNHFSVDKLRTNVSFFSSRVFLSFIIMDTRAAFASSLSTAPASGRGVVARRLIRAALLFSFAQFAAFPAAVAADRTTTTVKLDGKNVFVPEIKLTRKVNPLVEFLFVGSWESYAGAKDDQKPLCEIDTKNNRIQIESPERLLKNSKVRVINNRDGLNSFLDGIEWGKRQFSLYAFKAISGRSQTAIIEMFTDSRAILYLNGKLAGEVTADNAVAAGERGYLPILLKTGENIITIKQYSKGEPRIQVTICFDHSHDLQAALQPKNGLLQKLVYMSKERADIPALDWSAIMRNFSVSLEVRDVSTNNIVIRKESARRGRILGEGTQNLAPGIYEAVYRTANDSASEFFIVGNPQDMFSELQERLLKYNPDPESKFDIEAQLRRARVLLAKDNYNFFDRQWQEKTAYTFSCLATFERKLKEGATNIAKEQPGLHLRGFASKADNSFQTYRLFVPLRYKPDVPLPLLVIVSTNIANPERPFLEGPVMAKHREALLWAKYAEKHGFAILWAGYKGRPEGFSYESLNMEEAIQAVENNYNIDSQRVSVYATCGAGYNAGRLVSEYDNRFAAIVYDRAVFDIAPDKEQNPVSSILEWLQAASPPPHVMGNRNLKIFVMHDDTRPEGHGPLELTTKFLSEARKTRDDVVSYLSKQPMTEASRIDKVFGWLASCRNENPNDKRSHYLAQAGYASSLIIVGKNRVFRSEIGWLSGSFRMIGNRARLILSSVSLS